MNVVFLSPHFPHHYHRFCRQLKNLGANVLGVADVAHDRLEADVRDSLTADRCVEDLNHYDSLVRALGWFTHQFGKIDRLDSLNEYWLGVEASLRDDFNIFGVRGDGIDVIRRKSHMKARFQAAGVPVAPGRVVHGEKEARALIAETGYPVVVKPDAGVGALDTFRLDGDDDLARFFLGKPPLDYIMEGFVAGRIYSFDGLTDRTGRIIFHTAHTYSQGIMETVNEQRHVSYCSLLEIPLELENLGRACVAAFDVKERFFHIEFFRTGPQSYVALEVNIRPPGGFTTDMFNYAANIDIYRIWAELLVTGRMQQAPVKRKYHCCYASRKNRYAYRNSHEQIMERFGGDIVQVASVPGVFSSALGDTGYIFRSADLSQIEAITAYIQDAEGD
jgi:biotin carboxylase